MQRMTSYNTWFIHIEYSVVELRRCADEEPVSPDFITKDTRVKRKLIIKKYSINSNKSI